MIYNNKKAFSIIEYILLLVVIILAFIMLRPYIQRGMQGMWVKSGESFSYGRQYDSQKTIECAYYALNATNGVWYDRNCFEQVVGNQTNPSCASGDSACETPAVFRCRIQGSFCLNAQRVSDDTPN